MTSETNPSVDECCTVDDIDTLQRVSRRRVVGGGLAGFAALMAPTLGGCSSDDSSLDVGVDAGGDADATLDTDEADATVDAGADSSDGEVDAGPVQFPRRDIPARPALRSLIGEVGPLADEANEVGLRLPEGFTARIVATSGEVVAGTDYEWHVAPDGGDVFGTEDGGFIYVANCEAPFIGGVGAIRFDSSAEIVSAYRILDDTNVNCAGGRTPWHTWLSCEEAGNGRVFETDPWGEADPVYRPTLGVFKHEAAAVDLVSGHIYLTEDHSQGRFYRFVADVETDDGFPDLNSGVIEVALVDDDGNVTWEQLPDPTFSGEIPTREQVPASRRFNGGEGIWWHDGVVYFACKGENAVYAYDTVAETVRTIYVRSESDNPILSGVDNVTVSCCGDVLVAEDPGDLQVVAILPSGELVPLLQLVGHDSSEVTGIAFDPSGTRLFFSSQRGVTGRGGHGITFMVEGPFHEPV